MENNNQSAIKDEVITLILADMRNRKLIMGLELAGLSTDDYNTNLSELIFSKMGVSKQHEVRIGNWYEDVVFNFIDVDLPTFKQEQLFFAKMLYDSLIVENSKLQKDFIFKSKPTFSVLQSIGLQRCDN